MSDSKFVSKVEEIITCSICVELIDDPRVLQCLHTYCYKCLVQYLSSKDKQHEIECPICRKWCPLPNGNVDELPVSFLYNQLKDANTAAGGGHHEEQDEGAVVDEEEKVRFTCSTSECPGKKAVSFCEICRYICSECESIHKTIGLLKKHVILSLEEAVKDKQNELPACPKHPREIVKLYCEDCLLPICLLCYPLNHAQHKCSEIIEKSSKVKDELKDIVKTIDTYLDKCDRMTKLVEEHSEAVGTSADEMKRLTLTHLDKIQLEANQHKDVIIRGVDQKYNQAQKMLQQDTDRVNLLHMTLDSVKSCAVKVILYGKPCDFFQSVPSIQKQLDELNPDDVIITLKDLDVTEARSKLDNLKLIEDAMVKEQNLEAQYEKISRLRKTIEKERQEKLDNDVLTTQTLQSRDNDIKTLRKNVERERVEKVQNSILKTQELDRKVDEISKLRKKLESGKDYQDICEKKCVELALRNTALETELVLHQQNMPQPPGGKWSSFTSTDLELKCVFPDGIQNAAHPRPGQSYKGNTLSQNIYNTAQGIQVVKLLEKAFHARILVTVRENSLCWNGRLFSRLYYGDNKDPNVIRRRLAEIGIK